MSKTCALLRVKLGSCQEQGVGGEPFLQGDFQIIPSAGVDPELQRK